MTTKVVLPEHALAAIRLAIEGSANSSTALAIIDRLCAMAGTFDPESTQPTALLIEAIQSVNGTFTVAEA